MILENKKFLKVEFADVLSVNSLASSADIFRYFCIATVLISLSLEITQASYANSALSSTSSGDNVFTKSSR